MATPQIKLDQSGKPAGTQGQSRTDLALGVPVVCTDPANGAGVYAWELIAPPGSTATLNSTSAATVQFTPDVPGNYLVYLTFDGTKSWTENAIGDRIATQGGAGVAFANGTFAPGTGETTQFDSTHGWAAARHADLTKFDKMVPAVTGTAQGSIVYQASDGDLAKLAPGTATYLLASGGAGADPVWVDPATVGGAGTLDEAYDGGGSGAGRTITADAGAVTMASTAADDNNVLELTKNPGGSQAGAALSVTMGANATGSGVLVANAGSGASLSVDADSGSLAYLGHLRVDSNLLADHTYLSHYDNTTTGNWGIRFGPNELALNDDTKIELRINNGADWLITDGVFYANDPNGPALLNEPGASNNPTLIPDRSTPTTGVAGDGTSLYLVADSVALLEIEPAINGFRLGGTTSSFPSFRYASNLTQFNSTNTENEWLFTQRGAGTANKTSWRFVVNTNDITPTSGTHRFVSFNTDVRAFAPTSGTAAYRHFDLAYEINQTGGANGDLTGIYLDATETAVVGTHRLMDLRVGGTSQFQVIGATLTLGAGVLQLANSGNDGLFKAPIANARLQTAADFGTVVEALAASTSGTPAALFTVTGAAHTGLDNASITDVLIDLDRTVQHDGGSGPPAGWTNYGVRILGATYTWASNPDEGNIDATTLYVTPPDISAFTSGTGLAIHATGAVQIDDDLDITAGEIQLGEGVDIGVGTTTGTIFGRATSQKMAFWAATPVTQPAHIADPAGGATVDSEARTAINAILAQLATLGLQASS